MLKIVNRIETSDGKTFDSEDEARAHEIYKLLEKYEGVASKSTFGQLAVENAKEIIAILTDKPVANPRKPRKDKGVARAKPLPEAA